MPQLLYGQAPFFAASIPQTYWQIVNHEVGHSSGLTSRSAPATDTRIAHTFADLPQVPTRPQRLKQSTDLHSIVSL